MTQSDAAAAALLDALRHGATLKDVQNVPQQTMDGLYGHAYQFYRQGRLDDAEALFRVLCVYDFRNPEYALGLGAVCQLKQRYAQAIDLYALAFMLAERDYRPLFHIGQCHLLLGRAPRARDCFARVAEEAEDASLRQRAASYLDGLDRLGAAARPAEPAPHSEI